MTKQQIIDKYIDDIVNEIDYDIWKEGYNLKTAEDEEDASDSRKQMEIILRELISDFNGATE